MGRASPAPYPHAFSPIVATPNNQLDNMFSFRYDKRVLEPEIPKIEYGDIPISWTLLKTC